MMNVPTALGLMRVICDHIKTLPLDEQVAAINECRAQLHDISPFRAEPVDCVSWVKGDVVRGNEYNPNSVAPPEMELLRLSIAADGYTQPIVAFDAGGGARSRGWLPP